MRELGLDGFHVVLADLGVGPQLDDPARGFAFESCARLDMRYDPSAGISAWDVVNRTPERALSDILFIYGEERLSRQIAAAICRERQRRPIDTPAELSALIKRVAARRSAGRTWRIHPATRSAMAMRIYVNDELGELERLLEVLPSLLAPGGRAAVLSYHSLEARRVKLVWRRQQQEGLIEVLTRKAVKPSEDEIRQNPRARSAQLRVCARPEGDVTCS
jgi:16S rRNA (cytosine1402-N4)-methyltransferase